MTIKAVFLDVDDTLYDHQSNRIPEKHLEAIRILKEKGIKVALCSGRALNLIQNLIPVEPGNWDGVVAGNGSYAYDEQLNILFKKVIPQESAKALFDLAKKQQCGLFVAGNVIFVTAFTKEVQHVLDAMHVTGLEARERKEDDEFSIISFCRQNTLDPLEGIDDIENIRVIYNPLSTDIMVDKVSKTEGIAHLMKHWGFEPHEYMGFGDSLNDLEMLRDAEVGVAMANANPDLFPYANAIAPSCHEGGIYTWLLENGYLS